MKKKKKTLFFNHNELFSPPFSPPIWEKIYYYF